MSKLSDWVEQNTNLTQKKFDENNILNDVYDLKIKEGKYDLTCNEKCNMI